MRPSSRILSTATAGLLLAASQAQAANVEFQNFFFDVCLAPTGTLATRCAETPGATGNLSGDSESSLNPSQSLSHNQSAVSLAQTRSKEARERGEKLRDGDAEEPGAQVEVGPFSLLVNLHGTWFERHADPAVAAERGLEGDSQAAEIGLDYRASDRMVIGAIAGVERIEYDFDAEAAGVNFVPAANAGDADVDNIYLTLFASWNVGTNGYVELSGGYEQSDGSYRRNSVFQESTRTLPQTNVEVEGDADGDATWFSANAGFDFNRGAWNFGPYAGLTQTNSEVKGYTEQDLSGSGLHMRFSSTKRDSLLGHLGFRTSYAASAGGGVVVPQLRLEYQEEFEDDRQDVTAQYVLDTSGNQYTMSGDRGDKTSLNAGFSLAIIRPNGWMGFLDYSILLENSGLDRQRATLGLRVEF